MRAVCARTRAYRLMWHVAGHCPCRATLPRLTTGLSAPVSTSDVWNSASHTSSREADKRFSVYIFKVSPVSEVACLTVRFIFRALSVP